MSHRALVAVRRRDGRYDCYEVPDGSGARNDWPWGIDGGVVRETGGERFGGVPRRGPDVESSAQGASFRDVLDRYLDPLLHEALVVVEPDGEVRSYIVLPYLIATAEGVHPADPAGAAVALSGSDGASLSPGYARGWHHGVTDVLGEAIDRGLLSTAEAIDWLEGAVRRLAGDRHEVLAVPPSR